MIRFHEIKTYRIDAKFFKDKAIAQGWDERVVSGVISQLIEYKYPAPFVIDDMGKVYISNHYVFDLLAFEDSLWFDWYSIDDEIILQ